MVFGASGIGKSTACAFLPAPVFIDVERSAEELNITRDYADDWAELRGKLAAIEASPPDGVRSIVIDTATVAERFAVNHVVKNRLTEGGKHVESIEGFGWGKGWQYVHEEFNGLICDLDRLHIMGFNVCLICHDVASPVPNPAGEDFIRWEPHLYSGDKKGRGSIRERVRQWADHVVFIGYDVYVEKGKGQGSGSATIYTQELPTHIASSRHKRLAMDFDIEDPGAIWRELQIS